MSILSTIKRYLALQGANDGIIGMIGDAKDHVGLVGGGWWGWFWSTASLHVLIRVEGDVGLGWKWERALSF